MDDLESLTCPVCGAEGLTLVEVIPAHREGASDTGEDSPPPHDVPRTASVVCERCDSPSQFAVSEDWKPAGPA